MGSKLVDAIPEHERVRGPMHSPPHLGSFIRTEIVEPLGLSVTDAAEALAVDRTALSRLLNEKAALTWDMAIKIEKSFGPNAEHLMRMQHAYDEAQARKRRDSITINRVVQAPRE